MRRNSLYQMIMIALFAALCYIALWLFFFPVGPMYIHFGNLLLVTAALLIGGWQGGLAGALGMGLFDLTRGLAIDFPKTLVLKLLTGIIVGLVYHFLAKKKRFPLRALITADIVTFLAPFAVVLYYMLRWGQLSPKAYFLIVGFALLFVVMLVFTVLGKHRLGPEAACAVIGASCGLLFNIAGETSYAFVRNLLVGLPSRVAFLTAVVAQSSTLINAVIAVIGGVGLFLALKGPYQRISGSGK